MVARLKPILLHPFFLGCIFVYSLIRYLRSIRLPMPDWLNGQVTDLICIPVILMICLAGVRTLKRSDTLEIKPWLILAICAEYAVIFEWYLPRKSTIYTADWLDVAMYGCGGVLFYLLQPRLRSDKKSISS